MIWQIGLIRLTEFSCIKEQWLYIQVACVAGISGIMAAVETLQTSASVDIKHLRTMNPLVSSALYDWIRVHGKSALVPRQTIGTSNAPKPI